MKAFPRTDVLPVAQRQLWPALSIVKNEAFVLYGGTAVALYLGHRESVDFDFFTDRTFLPDELFVQFEFLHGAQILQSQSNTLTVLVRGTEADKDMVKISFFGGLSFGRLNDPNRTPDGALQVASQHDLLAHKLKVLLQRVEAKDYLDIDALLAGGLDLAAGLAGAKALFATFAPQECLKALTYFDDAALGELPRAVEDRLIRAAAEVRFIPEWVIKAKTLCD